jgi:hypothetical protein
LTDAAGKIPTDWSDQSLHVLNFYYANRQTDASGLMLEIALAGLMPGHLTVDCE